MQNGRTASELLAGLPELRYLPFDDFSRLDYGRLLWKSEAGRLRLERHWDDYRHPYRERFKLHGDLVRDLLAAEVSALQKVCRKHGTSLRAAIREIPPVFGHFWDESRR